MSLIKVPVEVLAFSKLDYALDHCKWFTPPAWI
jgi:hypothetical protein